VSLAGFRVFDFVGVRDVTSLINEHISRNSLRLERGVRLDDYWFAAVGSGMPPDPCPLFSSPRLITLSALTGPISERQDYVLIISTSQDRPSAAVAPSHMCSPVCASSAVIFAGLLGQLVGRAKLTVSLIGAASSCRCGCWSCCDRAHALVVNERLEEAKELLKDLAEVNGIEMQAKGAVSGAVSVAALRVGEGAAVQRRRKMDGSDNLRGCRASAHARANKRCANKTGDLVCAPFTVHTLGLHSCLRVRPF
jgi:hypothetical protein